MRLPTMNLAKVLGCVLLFAPVAQAAEVEAYLKGRGFFCTDYVQGRVFRIAPDGAVARQLLAPNAFDVWALPSGNLLFTVRNGVREVTAEGKTVFEYRTPSEVFTCQRLANGNTFVCECTTGRLVEVAPDGTTVAKEIRLLPDGAAGGHAYARAARVLPNGNYLVAHYGPQLVREYDANGKQVWEAKAPGGAVNFHRQPNGNTLVATGDLTKDPRILEVSREGQLVWEVSNANLPGAPLKCLTGVVRLPNGHVLISNWLGHGQLGKAPHLLEVTPDKKIVWTYANHKDLQTISTALVID